MKKYISVFIVLVLTVLIFGACSNKQSSTDKSEGELQSESYDTSPNYSGLDFTDIYGEKYSDIFKDKKLTVLNLFATWCSPCVSELPELQRLSQALEEQNIAVVGIVTDTRLGDTVLDDIVSDARSIADAAGVKYPMLIPDESNFKGYIDAMQAFPETLFIDKNGKIVTSVIGSNDFDGWMERVERAVELLEEK